MGPMSWMKCPLAGTNKIFLISLIKNTPALPQKTVRTKEDSKEPAKSQSQKEEGRQKHRSHPAKHSVRPRSLPGKRGQRGGHEEIADAVQQ